MTLNKEKRVLEAKMEKLTAMLEEIEEERDFDLDMDDLGEKKYWKQWEKLDEKADELQELIDALENAIESIEDYCD